jgi:hypothetical protein
MTSRTRLHTCFARGVRGCAVINDGIIIVLLCGMTQCQDTASSDAGLCVGSCQSMLQSVPAVQHRAVTAGSYLSC